LKIFAPELSNVYIVDEDVQVDSIQSLW